MADAKLAPNLPQWMIDHANRYLSSGGADGHMYKANPPGYGEMTVPSLLLTTTGRKSGEKFTFPLYYGDIGSSYIIVASKVARPITPAGTRISLPIPRSRSRSEQRSSRPAQGRPAAPSAPSCGKRP